MSEPSEYSSAVQPTVPIFEVVFHKGMWWSIPAELSQQIYEKYRNNEDVGYTWDWGNSRYGSWEPEGEVTSINRYFIDFNTWTQRTLDNNRQRSVRLVWVAAERVDPTWTGEIPEKSCSVEQPASLLKSFAKAWHSFRNTPEALASTAIPSLGGYGVAELEPFESQERGFKHGHRKKYAIPKSKEQEIIEKFKATQAY